jgi:two-component system sensor histidine kinase TctE
MTCARWRPAGLPRDIAPLVDAVNQQLARTDALMTERRRFIDDASHQLRTPLATLRAQVDYALREPDTVRARQALQALVLALDNTVRATNQLLALARSDAAAVQAEAFDAAELARETALALLPQARARGIDLGVDAPAKAAAPAATARCWARRWPTCCTTPSTMAARKAW